MKVPSYLHRAPEGHWHQQYRAMFILLFFCLCPISLLLMLDEILRSGDLLVVYVIVSHICSLAAAVALKKEVG